MLFRSRAYLDSVHELFPILHWQTFQNEVDQVYLTERSFYEKSEEWIGLFFAVLACGSLHIPHTSAGSPKEPHRASAYIEVATRALKQFTETVTITHAHLAFLLSYFTTESNMKSVGAMWLASAIRIAQCLGCHADTDAPVAEGEMRRRLWWSIYTWDR